MVYENHILSDFVRFCNELRSSNNLEEKAKLYIEYLNFKNVLNPPEYIHEGGWHQAITKKNYSDEEVTRMFLDQEKTERMKAKQPKEYEINSFERLCNIINEDNFESLTTDLVMWLGYHVKYMKQLRKTLPKKYTKDKTNWDLGKSSFIWIDDGKNDMKFVRVKNQLTGEIKTFELMKDGQ